jgi:hypothetical protein
MPIIIVFFHFLYFLSLLFHFSYFLPLYFRFYSTIIPFQPFY